MADVAPLGQHLARGGKQLTGTDVAEALAARWQMMTATASGLLAGVQPLLSYARGEQATAAWAIEEERGSGQAALQAVRPVLQARWQQRWDEVDEQSPDVRCLGGGRSGQLQGR